MNNLLLVTSLLLNVVVILCIVILYVRQNRFLEVEQKQGNIINELEEVITTYLIEMKDENEKLIKKVKELTSSHPTTLDSRIKNEVKTIGFEEGQIGEEIEHSEPFHENRDQTNYLKGTAFQAVQAYKNSYQPNGETQKPPNNSVIQGQSSDSQVSHSHQQIQSQTNETANQEEVELSFLDQVLLLKEQGLSNMEIAKTLNAGKTEIELLLKFQQKK